MGYNAQVSEKDEKKAMDTVLKRMLNTPPKPKQQKPKKRAK